MERIPLPAHVVAAQQQIKVAANGDITRDRLLVVQQRELVPVVAVDPVVREYATKQLARQRLQDVVGAQVLGIFLVSAVIPLVIIPAIIYLGCRFW